MKKIIFTLFSLVLISCNNSNKNKTGFSKDEPSKELIEFKILNTPKNDLTKLNYNGEILNKKFWQDSNGENIVLFTRKEHELFIYHYAIESGNIRLLRKVFDFTEEGCEYDLIADFIEKSITVTDLDNNNFGEITFAYKLACISDLSPLDLKLLILENQNKYIIRGSTSINMGDKIIIGDKNIDSSFEKASPKFLEYANKVWEDVK